MTLVLSDDLQYDEHTVRSVRAESDGAVSITRDDGWSIYAAIPDGVAPPEPGDTLRVYGRGIGYAVRGICWHKPGSQKLHVSYYLTPEEGEARDEAYRAKLQAEHEARLREPIEPTGHPVYEWTADMGQISGFGSGYEAACRKMTVAGVEWLKSKPEITMEDIQRGGAHATAFDDAVMGPCPDCSGAMLGAAKNHAAFIWANGWDAYCESMRSRVKP